MSNTATVSYNWSIKGKQPLVDCKKNKRERLTTFDSVNIKTGQMIINFTDKGNYKNFKKHLEKVLSIYKEVQKILDNERYHHAKE